MCTVRGEQNTTKVAVMYGRYKENDHFQVYVAAAGSGKLQSCCDSVIDRT